MKYYEDKSDRKMELKLLSLSEDDKLIRECMEQAYCCRDSGCNQIFRRDTRTGSLSDTGRTIVLDKPVSLHFVLVFCKCLNSNELSNSLWRSLTKDNRLIH